MTTIQTTASSSTCSSDSSGREVAKHALNSARTVSGLAVIVKGVLRASFSSDQRATKPTAASTSVEPATSAPVEPAAAPAAKREHPPLTEDRVAYLLHMFVDQEWRRGEKQRDRMLAKASRRLNDMIGKDDDLSPQEKCDCWELVDGVNPKLFWTAHFTGPNKPERKAAPAAPKTAAPKPQAMPEKKTDAPSAKPKQKAVTAPKVETRKAETKDNGQDLNITDEIVALPAPAPVVSSKTAAPQKTEPKPAPHQERVLFRLPLTTPGHLEDVFTLFTERGMSARQACSRLFHEIERDESLSETEEQELKAKVRAWLPKRPSFMDEGCIETMLQQSVDQWEKTGRDPEEAICNAVDEMLCTIRHKVEKRERGKAHDRMKDFVKSRFVKLCIEAGGTSKRATDGASKYGAWCFEQGFRELKLRLQGRSQSPRSESAPLMREPRVDTPKVCKSVLLTREEQETRAAAKKARRMAQAEASAEASRQIAGVVETAGDARRRHRAKQAATVNGKKGKQGGNGQRRQQEARA